MASQPVDLFQAALSMDPRFGENMPQDVADAFASGDVARVFRTSADLAPAKNVPGSIPMTSQAGRPHGDYGGSIYVQTHSGRTARWKQTSMGDDQGWNANKGHGSFFENAVTADTTSFDDSVEDLARGGMPTAQATATAAEQLGTPVAASSSRDMLGKKVVEYQREGDRVRSHPGHEVSDVFESTGERHYFKGDPSASARGVASTEPVSDFMSRSGVQTPAMEVRDKGKSLVQKTIENKQEEVQQDLQESAEEKGAETVQDVLKEKAQEKAQEIAKDKVKEAVKETSGPKETPKGGVRVRKASTTCFCQSTSCSF
jgi:hypothetical protein